MCYIDEGFCVKKELKENDVCNDASKGCFCGRQTYPGSDPSISFGLNYCRNQEKCLKSARMDTLYCGASELAPGQKCTDTSGKCTLLHLNRNREILAANCYKDETGMILKDEPVCIKKLIKPGQYCQSGPCQCVDPGAPLDWADGVKVDSSFTCCFHNKKLVQCAPFDLNGMPTKKEFGICLSNDYMDSFSPCLGGDQICFIGSQKEGICATITMNVSPATSGGDSKGGDSKGGKGGKGDGLDDSYNFFKKIAPVKLAPIMGIALALTAI